MTLASDQNLDPDRLSPNARRLHELRDKVLMEWSKRLRETVEEAAPLSQPILVNTFPALYENLAQAITPGYPRATGAEGNTVASEHGGERARLTNYNARAVISEYQLLRWTIFDVLRSEGVRLDDDEVLVINQCIDAWIREAVNAFALAQLALRERFVATLTHDLRNPLSAAHAAAEFIKRSSESERIQEFAARITANLTRVDGMIQDLLDSVTFQSGERLRLRLEPFDMLQLAKEVCDEFVARHGPRFQLVGNSAAGWWDRQAIKRAMENLLGNAVKYGAPGTPARIKIDSYQGRTIVSVHNEGDPIPAEELESIFKVFVRAAAAKEGDASGWGIGLPYVRSVAESHGGSVGVDTAPGRGTTLVIDIPSDSRPFQDAPTLGKATD